jgi:hypothetical protein
MKSGTFPLALIFVSLACFSQAQQIPLTVTTSEPQPNATVEQRDTVSGSVSDPQAKVWVVVHPIGTSEFWVQPPVTLNTDGTWSVLAYFGREGLLDRGNLYEIRAFVNPSESLESGERRSWPLAAAESQSITVTRKTTE